MTSIKIHYRPTTKSGVAEGKLFIRVIHKRKSRTIRTGYVVRSVEWDSKTGTVIYPQNDSVRDEYLARIAEKLSADKRRLESILSELSLGGEYNAGDIVTLFRNDTDGSNHTITGYCEKLCARLEKSGQQRTARAYRSAVASLQKFRPDRLLTLPDINSETMEAFERYLLEKGLYLNTVSFYMRQLRAVYNRAVREKVTPRQQDNPFSDVFTGVHQTRRRALTEVELNKLASLEWTFDKRIAALQKSGDSTSLDEAEFYLKLKNILLLFLFCFHARGMSFIDMAYLKKSDVGNETLIYKRSKTGCFLEVGITRPMREIMDWFAARQLENARRNPGAARSPYVFPVIDPSRGNERRQYESGLRRQNQFLGLLSRMAGLEKKVTTHVSRHTWATVAKWRQVSVAVISEALGHRDAKTTEHYLASFEQSVLDKLSAEISGVIKKGRETA